NGVRIDLDRRSANFTKVTAASADASCPYLLSWSEAEGWIEHGKALHQGKGMAREYTETIQIEGFRPRFKLEEREPEAAFIDEAVLQIIVKGGDTFSLKPDNITLAARDGKYVPLYWGDAVEFSFGLPDHLKEEDVVSSLLQLTGYYE